MEQDILIYIDDKEKLDASVVANSFAHKDVKNRAYINTLGAELAMKYLVSENIDVSNTRNIHSIKKILEENDIADILLPNIHIDVRVIFDENLIFIPKSHFELELTPDIYLVFNLSQDKTFVKFLGFFEPKLINKNNQNSEYYFIEKEKLSLASDLMNYINTHHGSTDRELSDEDFEAAENFIVSMADNDISDNDKKYLIKQLLKSAELRDKFIEFENFETLSYKAINDPMIEKKEPLPLETFNELENFNDITELENSPIELDSFEDISAEEENKQTVDEIPTESMVFENIEIPETTDVLETADFDDILLADIELPKTDIPTENSNIDTLPTEEPAIDTISLDTIELPQEDSIMEEPATDLLALNDDIEPIQKEDNIVEEPVLETLSLDNINPIQTEDNLIEETNIDTISLDNIELPQEENTIEEKIDDTLSLDNVEPIQAEEIPVEETLDNTIALDGLESIELPQEVEKTLNEDTELMAFDDIEPINPEAVFNNTDSLPTETSADMPFETENISDNIDDFAELPDIIESQEQDAEMNDDVENTSSEAVNNITEEVSFGKNLLENLSAEDEDKIQIEDLGDYNQEQQEDISANDLLAQIDNVLGSSSMAESLDTNVEIAEDEILSADSIDNILNGENELDILYGEQNTSEGIPEQPELSEDEVEQTTLPGARLYNKKTTDKKSLLIAAALIAVLAAGSAFVFLKPKNDTVSDIEPLPAKKETPTTPQGSPEDILASNTPQAPVKKDIKAPKQVVKELKSNPPKPIKSESFLEVNKLVWDVPDSLSYSSKMQNYLRTAGRSIKLSLSTDLLLATEYAYSNQVKVGLKLAKNGSVQDARILSSSGSTQIDNIVLQSVKDTLNVVKPPSDEVKTPDFNLSLIIYF